MKMTYVNICCTSFCKLYVQTWSTPNFAECAPQNTPTWKIMEKINLQCEAHFKKNVSFRKDENGFPIYWDTYVYARLNPSFESK